MMMRCPTLLLSLLTLPTTLLAQNEPQIPLNSDSPYPPHTKRVAIIGAGAAGASTAYHLRKLATAEGIPLNITIYDRNTTVGGRSETIHPWSDATQPALELGASIFVSVNKILVDATKEFGLSTARTKGAAAPLSWSQSRGTPDLGIWDGEKMVVVVEREGGWLDLGRLVWRYGLAPWKTMRLMRRTVAKFLRMYDDVFPFEDLNGAVRSTGLADVVAATGQGYLDRWEIKGPFGREVVQASTRVNYAIGLGKVSGLVAMVCMATDGAMSVQGGNWKIFEGMVERSGAIKSFGTEVVSVREGLDHAMEVTGRAVGAGREEVTEPFDEVVLATPYQFSDVAFDDLENVPEKVPYVELHVTMLTSKHRLDPVVFGYEKGQRVPRAVLTTTMDDEGEQDPGFNSISLLREVVNPSTKQTEFAYKIFTMTPVNSTFLGKIFGLGDLAKSADIGKEDISWIYRKVWSSYPYEYPRVTFEDTKLAQHVWYTGGMDSFISTMETNGLMGKNVARLMINSWLTVHSVDDITFGLEEEENDQFGQMEGSIDDEEEGEFEEEIEVDPVDPVDERITRA